MYKPRVLLIQEDLKNYRGPIYSLINEKVDLTVGYTNTTDLQKASYSILQLPHKKIGPLIWHTAFRRIINQYDVVVFAPYLHAARLVALPFLPHRPKLITWSIGVHASYTRHYDLSKDPDFRDRFMEFVQDHCDACVFYMPEPIDYWKKHKGINEKKYFVAHNTVAVAPFDEATVVDRNIILFVGTLYKQKGVEELIECYAKAKEKVGKLPALVIVGKGPEKDAIEQRVKELHLENDVELTGAIYDENILKDYFLKSVICVSPKQAGLTVLKSLGYGVPFVTRTDAITGGEKANVLDRETGLFYNTEEELVDLLAKTASEPKMFAAMSCSARKYYLTEASPEGMAQGVLDAIRYVVLSKYPKY